LASFAPLGPNLSGGFFCALTAPLARLRQGRFVGGDLHATGGAAKSVGMNLPLDIRDARLDDVDTIVDFNVRLAAESEDKSLDRATLRAGVLALLAEPAHGRYFVACRGASIVGQVMLTYEWSDWRNGRIWWIQSVYVPPEARRQGIFRALFQHVRGLAQSTPGTVGLRLYVEQDNTRAHQVYRNLGLNEGGYFVMQRMLTEQGW
jgi:GNAT superfamily N-acetyltransferase